MSLQKQGRRLGSACLKAVWMFYDSSGACFGQVPDLCREKACGYNLKYHVCWCRHHQFSHGRHLCPNNLLCAAGCGIQLVLPHRGPPQQLCSATILVSPSFSAIHLETLLFAGASGAYRGCCASQFGLSSAYCLDSLPPRL